MSYVNLVTRLRLKELELRATEFAEGYDPDRRSLVLLPGGMGSRLLQSLASFSPPEPFPGNPEFREIWARLGVLLRGGIAELRMTEDGRDRNSRPIIAAGELSSFVKKYDGAQRYFTDKANYVAFGYDWRKSPRSEATFLRDFLQRIRAKVIGRGHPDPLPELTLLGHSQGGLVAKLFINDIVDRGEDPRNWFFRFISVGSPFYGTANHLDRYYIGVLLPNLVTGGARTVAEITASMPGPYVLMPAPAAVIKPRFAQLGLARYPVRDREDLDLELDPFDPALEVRLRFPPFMVNDYFSLAEDLFAAIDRDIPEASEQIFHIRSNTHGDAPLEIYWEAVDGATFDHNGESPISTNAGASDNTVPLWSARLAATPDQHIFDLTGAAHGGLAEHPVTLRLVEQLMTDAGLPPPGRQPIEGDIEVADLSTLEDLLEDIRLQRINDEDLANLTPPIQRGLEDGLMLA